MHVRAALVLVPALVPLMLAGPMGASSSATEMDLAPPPVPDVTSSAIASLAQANVGGMACAKNSLGGTTFGSSCTGNGGQPEYWCADFALWVWKNAGVSDVAGLDAAAGSFYVYGQNHGTLKNTPTLGDAVVFNYQGGGVADHVALVSQVNADGTIETISGDWNGQSGSEAQFSSTSHVVLNAPAYTPTVGSAPGVMGMTISGFISPVGLSAVAVYGAGYVGQSFPLAATALKMTAGQTIPSYIELKNVGQKVWDSKTRLGTTQPRDRVSAFADSSWVADNRPAGVSGTVAPGGTYKFTFNLHAPDKPGTYFEYFGVVEEGVAWFSDPGQGGPPDNDLEVQIVVEAAPDAGAPHDGGAHVDAGGHAEAGAGAPGGGTPGTGGGSGSGSGGGVVGGDDGGSPDGGSSGDGASPSQGGGGCSAAPGGVGIGGIGWVVAALGLMGARRRRA